MRRSYLELIERIQDRYSSLSKNHRKVADYIANNGMAASFDSITELAPKMGNTRRAARQLGIIPSRRPDEQTQAKFYSARRKHHAA